MGPKKSGSEDFTNMRSAGASGLKLEKPKGALATLPLTNKVTNLRPSILGHFHPTLVHGEEE